MQARQLQNFPARPNGQGFVFDISQEEYDKHPGLWRWIADEQKAEQAARERAALAEHERHCKLAQEARAAQLHDLRQQIQACEGRQRVLREQIAIHKKDLDQLDAMLAKRRELLDDLQQRPVELPKAPTVPQVTVVAEEPKQERSPVDIRGGVRRIRGQS